MRLGSLGGINCQNKCELSSEYKTFWLISGFEVPTFETFGSTAVVYTTVVSLAMEVEVRMDDNSKHVHTLL